MATIEVDSGYFQGKVIDALAITDQAAHVSDILHSTHQVSYTFLAVNGLNQTVGLVYAGSLDGVVYHNLASSISVTAAADDVETLTDDWRYIKVTATCAVAPASGSLTIFYGTGRR